MKAMKDLKPGDLVILLKDGTCAIWMGKEFKSSKKGEEVKTLKTYHVRRVEYGFFMGRESCVSMEEIRKAGPEDAMWLLSHICQIMISQKAAQMEADAFERTRRARAEEARQRRIDAINTWDLPFS